MEIELSKPTLKGGQLVILQVLSEGMPQARGYRGKDGDHVATCPCKPQVPPDPFSWAWEGGMAQREPEAQRGRL